MSVFFRCVAVLCVTAMLIYLSGCASGDFRNETSFRHDFSGGKTYSFKIYPK